MKKMYRSALFAGVAAFGLAACGDDVTVVEPTPPPTPALQVSLTPSNQSVNVGAVADFVVTIAGGAEGAAASWTCGSSAPSVASVAATATGCRATGAAAGAATITATVTKGNQSASAGGQVTVNALPTPPAPPTVVPATVTIASVTRVNTFSPVAVNNVYGQIDVTLNINPNDQRVTRADVLVDGVVAATQNVAIGVAGEDAAESAVQQVILSLNTADYAVNATAGTALPAWLNGQRQVSARITTQGSSAVPAASNLITLNFKNGDGIHVLGTLPTNSATDALGQIWYGGPDAGSTTFTAIPVMYSGRAIASVTYGGGFCPAAGTEVTTVAAAPFTFSRRCATTSATGLAPLFNSMGTDGNAGPAFFVAPGGYLNAAAQPFPIRVDNVAPAGAAIRISQVTALQNQDNWVNAAYTFTTGYVAPTDAGVGLSTTAANVRRFQVRQGTTVVAGHDFSDNPQTPAALENTVNNAGYNVRVEVRDLLGNTTPVAQSAGAAPNTAATFGVDKVAPIVANNGSVADSTIMNVGAGIFSANFSDALSGFAGAGAIRHNLVRIQGGVAGQVRTAIAGAGTINSTPFATAAAGTAFLTATPAAAGYLPAPTLITSDAVAVPAGNGYYIYQASARDKAGNVSPMFTRRVFVNNGVIPAVVGLNSTATYVGGAPAVFPAVASDDTELLSGEIRLAYPNVGFDLIYPRPNPTFNAAFDDAGFTQPTAFEFTIPAFIRGIQVVDGAGAPQADFATARPNAVRGRVFNVFGNGAASPEAVTGGLAGIAADFPAPILVTQVAAGTNFAAAPAATLIGSWAAAPVCGTVVSTFRTCTITVTLRGPSGTFVNPFAAIGIIERSVAVGDGFRLIHPASAGGVLPASTTVTVTPNFAAPFPTLDNGVNRDFTYTITIRRPSGAGNFNYHLVGITSAFDALATQRFTLTF